MNIYTTRTTIIINLIIKYKVYHHKEQGTPLYIHVLCARILSFCSGLTSSQVASSAS